MGKYKMPTVQQFLEKKKIYDKKEPVWVYLEREMRENVDKKPYNEKVGEWLRFLKDLRYYFYCEAKRKYTRLVTEVGPPWYCELSSSQREVLHDLKANIHQDLLEDIPRRVRRSLSDLGITLKIPKVILMKAMNASVEDPGIFIWNLYTEYYKKSPSELRPEYDMNSMILMSSLVFIDLEECTDRLEKLTACERVPTKMPEPKQKKNSQPNVRYGEYLQKCYVPCYSSHTKKNTDKDKPLPLGFKFRLRSVDSYEKLCKNQSFLEKRKERNKKQKQEERVCNYKFWEPPSTLRNKNPKMAAMANKLKELKNKPKPKYKAPYKNVQYNICGVAFSGGKPNYLINGVSLLPTGYVPINAGLVSVGGEQVTTIVGYWKFPRTVVAKCDGSCDCNEKWEETVMNYLENSKCRCGHLYDYNNTGKVKDKYFYPPTRHGKHWFDSAKIFQMDSLEDFIRDTVKDALMSTEPSREPSMPTLLPSGLKLQDLLEAFLAELSDTPLLIPHLPKASLLNNLLEWVRKRIKGKMTPADHKRLILQSQRRWLDLKHIDFRAIAYRIPFTLKQLEHMNWSHRYLIQTLFKILLDNFVTRNRLQQLTQTRLWWTTTKYDVYPSKAFLDIFFTYMPGRMKDTFLINPYSSELTPKYGAKTCPLGN
ncbi:uncharacterized protein LOC123709791 isoform X1 [Pieris brassicae]|uniref:uncharacterized protein LOC123709791 isoform X1 n=2 Tax=Pieris brassicae TaxID=7116 RepID=UPI001E65EFD2|nr:uncharacterized protein LOC123709791 isoform X1 [Pieris brassicae]